MTTRKTNPAKNKAVLKIVITRIFDAPRSLVYEAWTQPAHLKQWCAPHGFTVPISKGDLRPGGAWEACMRKPDGEKLPLGGVYRKIVKNSLLVFTHAWEGDDGKPEHETLVTVRFADQGRKTKVVFEQSHFKSIESRDGHKGGWTQCFERLAAHLAESQKKSGRGNAKENKSPSQSGKDEVVITHVFDAPRALVFQAWTDPKQVVQWWGPRGFTNPVCEWDARAGKPIYVIMRAPNGTDYPMSGEFREITPPERLVFTSGALDKKGNLLFEFLHTAKFAEKSGKTTLTLRSRIIKTTPGAEKYTGGFKAGMTQSLERLGALLASDNNLIVVERTFDAPVARVWKALTNKKDFGQWSCVPAEFKPKIGFEFQFAVENKGVTYLHLCKITEAIPRKKLAYTWRYEGHPGDSLVTFELFSEGGKTRVRLTHAGVETFPKTPDFARANFVEGWTQIVGTHLKKFVETSNRK